jgi:heparosan-N-sulfate-glucuronate 5-epimerase
MLKWSMKRMASPIWRRLPIIGFLASEWQTWREEQMRPCYGLTPEPPDGSELSPYPIDMWPLLALPFGILDETGVLYSNRYKGYPPVYHPTAIAQYALARWNVYLATGDEQDRQAFMTQAYWLVSHESRFANGAGGWLLPYASFDYNTPVSWLSALTQGNGISVLTRAYQITHEEAFLEVARRAVRTYELDILDGGVSTAIGETGVFFEEDAVYPASHVLNGYIFALFGLYDYIAITGDSQIAALIQRSLAALHTLIDQFDTGYWSRYELLHKVLAPRFYHDQHSVLLEALARYSHCEHCVALAARWRGYQHSLRCRLCYFSMSRFHRYRRGLQRLGTRGVFLHILGAEGQSLPKKTVPVPITAPPVSHLGSSEREVKEEHV